MIDFIDNKLHYLYLNGNKDRNTVLLLHSTGGDEIEMIDIARYLYPKNPILGIRGRVQENGVINRWFKRRKEGDFDIDSLYREEAILIKRVNSLISELNLNPRLNVIGYSNGANVALHLELSNQIHFEQIMAYHPMMIEELKVSINDQKSNIFISHGEDDPIVPDENFHQLLGLLENSGHNLEIYEFNGEHSLTNEEIFTSKKIIKNELV
ncbi:MAG: dienelactone hydrolase family protein [Lactobacillaceae bacterium]|jgi:phospholipase/carboxylesterase|nr:dienelactone hydrolase family protein [Lactobacillaceae bacterium]